MFTDINIYSINNKTDHISENYIFYRKKSWTKLNETDPRIRIHIKIKRIRNTEYYLRSL